MGSQKRIYSISMVKNEMDIIESFIRYNTNILDGMIILDNGSTDKTLNILKKLQKEKYNLHLYQDENREFDKVKKMTQLLKKAVEEYNADIIIPLDADEFIISKNKGNPRKHLETIQPHTYHLILWKTYIPYLGNQQHQKFIPSKITHTREENIERTAVIANSKIVIPKNLVKKYDVKIARGSHDLEYDPSYDDEIKKIYDDNLRIAHFPIRSIEQTISKITIGWLNALSSLERKKNQSHHWKKMFDHLKNNEKISKEDIIKYATEYALKNEGIEVEIKEDPIDLSFCKNIDLKYTQHQINPLANLLEECENFSTSYLKLKKEKIALEKEQYSKKSQKVHQNKNDNKRFISQRFFSKFPSLYILLQAKNKGIKNALTNIKGYRAIKKHNLLDVGYYLKNNKDVHNSGMDPILHYLYHGYKEGRNPNPSFNSEYYLNAHNDVKNSNLQPLIHYALYGIQEGRKTSEYTLKNEIKIHDKNLIFKDVNKISDSKGYYKNLNPVPNRKSIKTKLKKLHTQDNIKISIKVPAPDWKSSHYWGDYHLALALKKEFEKNNYETELHLASEWEKEDDADVVLVIRGLLKCPLNPEKFNIMWNISHPDLISLEEYNRYDHVFIASDKWFDKLKNKLNIPVQPLLQFTDPELFYPEYDAEYEHELLFVGNNKKYPRKIIQDLLPTKRDFGLYGKYWNDSKYSKYVCDEHIPNLELNKAYSSCDILLNDHWKDMREKGFISNRIFDGFASGAFIISDEIDGAKDIFEDSLITYSHPQELKELVDYYIEDSEKRTNLAEKGRKIVLKHHTVEARVKSILEVINNKN